MCIFNTYIFYEYVYYICTYTHIIYIYILLYTFNDNMYISHNILLKKNFKTAFNMVSTVGHSIYACVCVSVYVHLYDV